MSDPAPMDVVRARFPLTPDQDQDELRAHAEHLERLRRSLRAEELSGAGIAVTFDPRGAVSDD